MAQEFTASELDWARKLLKRGATPDNWTTWIGQYVNAGRLGEAISYLFEREGVGTE